MTPEEREEYLKAEVARKAAVEELTLEQVRTWAKQLHAEGKELKLVWEGGNDSGWAHFQIDEEEADTPETDFLVDMCYDELDYGSWAGDYNASGEAVYDPEKEAFVGIDTCSTDDYQVFNEPPIIFRIPASVKFDRVEVELQTQDEQTVAVNVGFVMHHGFISPEMAEIEQDIAEAIEKQYEEILAAQDDSYRTANDADVFARQDMVLSEDGQFYEAVWTNYTFTIEQEEHKDIVLSLKEEEDE